MKDVETLRELVIASYQAILGREPENEEVIRGKILGDPSARQIISEFVQSPEFSQKFLVSLLERYYRTIEDKVNIDLPEEDMNALLAKVCRLWEAIGNTEPHWSVLTHERFRSSQIKRNEEDFYRTGRDSAELISVFCERNGVTPTYLSCLELGCGVGRVTLYLAELFRHVIAADVSGPNLRLAKTYLSDARRENIEYLKLSSFYDVERISGYNFFYSMIVLQHNPPPVIKKILKIVLTNLRRDGVFLFQVPTDCPGYRFDAQLYLVAKDGVEDAVERHCLPMHAVLDVIHEAGCQIKEVRPDPWLGCLGSYTFFGVKT